MLTDQKLPEGVEESRNHGEYPQDIGDKDPWKDILQHNWDFHTITRSCDYYYYYYSWDSQCNYKYTSTINKINNTVTLV